MTTPSSGARISIERWASLFASFSSISRILVFSASISSAVVIAVVASWYWASFSFTYQPELAAFELLQLGLRLHPGLLARLVNSFSDAWWRSTKARNKLYYVINLF